MITVPIEYHKSAIDDPNLEFEKLKDSLDWVRHYGTPRSEYYVNDVGVPYQYSTYNGSRPYLPQKWTPQLRNFQNIAQRLANCVLEVCFLNYYHNSKDHLGWHADDSPEMDDDRPIVILSIGAEREIWFREKNREATDVSKLLLENGSACVMAAGMQDTHVHRIPKCDRGDIGPRISLTFRGFVR